jgi:membrane protein DedA with SNARE-associated domain
VFQWPLALAVSALGVVVSDVMLYSAGRHLAWRSIRESESRLLTPERLQRMTRWFARLGNYVIFFARLTPGTRALVFVTAGVRPVPVWSFLRYDVLGAALWVPAMLALGHASGSRIGDLEDAIGWLNQSVLWVVALTALFLVIWLSWGREESKL